MDIAESTDTFNEISLCNLAIEAVFQYYIRDGNKLFDGSQFRIDLLPDPLIFSLIRRCLKDDSIEKESDETAVALHLWDLRKKMNISLSAWYRLLKYEKYRLTLMQFFHKSSPENVPISWEIFNQYSDLCQTCVATNYKDDAKRNRHFLDVIKQGLTFGGFFNDASWYDVTEQILTEVLRVIVLLPENDVSTHIIMLEWYHTLFHTYIMYFMLNKAALLIPKVLSQIQILEDHKIDYNCASIYADFSRYNFFRNDYNESYKWILKAIRCLNRKTSLPTQIQVLRQASKVCVVKRDYVKAKFLIHQAVVRANEYYGPTHYELASVLLDLGFYLLNADENTTSAAVYKEAYKLRADTFGYRKNNLLVAIAEEDLAYILYVKQYMSGLFDEAMDHVERAIAVMTKLLPSGNLMLCSANRVKALILEEQALDNFHNYSDSDVDEMLLEAETLHQTTLMVTRKMFGERNILTAKHYGNLGRLYQSMRRFEEAEMMHLRAIKIKEEIVGKDDYEVGLSVGHLASLYNYHMFEFKKAEQLYLRSIEINLKMFSESYSAFDYDYRGLINVYENLGDDQKRAVYEQKLRRFISLRDKNSSTRIQLNFRELKDIIDMFESSACLVDTQSNGK